MSRTSLSSQSPAPKHAHAFPPTSAPTTTSISLLTASALTLSANPSRQFDSQTLHYLTIEMVRTLRESARVERERAKEKEEELKAEGLLDLVSARSSSETYSGNGMPDGYDEEAEALALRLEAVGYHVGVNLVEKLTRDRARFPDTLDVLKFVCKDVWSVMWDKQVDNLRTNHRGVYVLQDNIFRPLTRISSTSPGPETARKAKPFLSYPVGVIRGALACLGLSAAVVAESTTLPQCSFHVKTNLPKT